MAQVGAGRRGWPDRTDQLICSILSGPAQGCAYGSWRVCRCEADLSRYAPEPHIWWVGRRHSDLLRLVSLVVNGR